MIYPPNAALIPKLLDKYRFQISIKSLKSDLQQNQYLQQILHKSKEIYDKNYSKPSVSVRIDVDSYRSV
jgi:primosomal protein N'